MPNTTSVIKVHDEPESFLAVSGTLVTGDTRAPLMQRLATTLTANRAAVIGIKGRIALNIGLHNPYETIRNVPLTAKAAAVRRPGWVLQPAINGGTTSFWLQAPLDAEMALALDLLHAAQGNGWSTPAYADRTGRTRLAAAVAVLRSFGCAIATHFVSAFNEHGRLKFEHRFISASDVSFLSPTDNLPVIELRQVLPRIAADPHVRAAIDLEHCRRERLARARRRERLDRWAAALPSLGVFPVSGDVR